MTLDITFKNDVRYIITIRFPFKILSHLISIIKFIELNIYNIIMYGNFFLYGL